MWRLRVIDISNERERWCDGEVDNSSQATLYANETSALADAQHLNETLTGSANLYWIAIYPVKVS